MTRALTTTLNIIHIITLSNLSIIDNTAVKAAVYLFQALNNGTAFGFVIATQIEFEGYIGIGMPH